MSLVRVSRGETRCITKDQVKLNERISHSSEDTLIDLWIDAAEDLVERRMNRSIMRSTYRLSTQRVTRSIGLLMPPVSGEIALSKISYAYGEDDFEDLAIQGLVNSGGEISPLYNLTGIARAGAGRMVVEYEAGATNPLDVPAAIRQAVLLIASHWYRSREAVSTDSRMRAADTPLPFGADALIAVYRIPNVNVALEDHIL